MDKPNDPMTVQPSSTLLVRTLKGEVSARPPFWLMRQAGRHLPEYRRLRERERNFLKFCYNPDLAIEATLQPVERYRTDAAILFSDILVIPDSLGRRVAFEEKIGPVLEPIRRRADIPVYDKDRLLDHLAPVFETVKGLTKALPPEVALIGFAGAPWTVAVYMVEGQGGTDHGAIRRWSYEAPDEFSALMAVLTEATADYLIRQIDAGANVIQLFDTWSGILPEGPYRRWVIEPTAVIVRRLKQAHPDVPIIGFPRGSGALYQAYVEATGVDGVGIDSTVQLDWARQTLQSRVAVQGNLDNLLLVVGGEAMDREIDRIVATLGSGPFVFNLGHGILPQTPPDHVERLAERIHALGADR